MNRKHYVKVLVILNASGSTHVRIRMKIDTELPFFENFLFRLVLVHISIIFKILKVKRKVIHNNSADFLHWQHYSLLVTLKSATTACQSRHSNNVEPRNGQLRPSTFALTVIINFFARPRPTSFSPRQCNRTSWVQRTKRDDSVAAILPAKLLVVKIVAGFFLRFFASLGCGFGRRSTLWKYEEAKIRNRKKWKRIHVNAKAASCVGWRFPSTESITTAKHITRTSLWCKRKQV